MENIDQSITALKEASAQLKLAAIAVIQGGNSIDQAQQILGHQREIDEKIKQLEQIKKRLSQPAPQ